MYRISGVKIGKRQMIQFKASLKVDERDFADSCAAAAWEMATEDIVKTFESGDQVEKSILKINCVLISRWPLTHAMSWVRRDTIADSEG